MSRSNDNDARDYEKNSGRNLTDEEMKEKAERYAKLLDWACGMRQHKKHVRQLIVDAIDEEENELAYYADLVDDHIRELLGEPL